MFSKTLFDSPDVALMRALKFSSKDLDANRDSVMTTGQKKRIRRWQLAWSMPGWLIVLFLAWIFSRGDVDPAMRFLCLLLILGSLTGLFWYQHKVGRLLSIGKLYATRGPITGGCTHKGQWRQTCWIDTPDKRFIVSQTVYETFFDGYEYTIYYVPDIDYILSIDCHPTSLLNARQRGNMQRPPARIADQKNSGQSERGLSGPIRNDLPPQARPRVAATTHHAPKRNTTPHRSAPLPRNDFGMKHANKGRTKRG